MQVSHLQKGLLSSRQALLGAKAPVPCRQNFQRVVVRAEGEGKKEEEEKKGGAVATVDRSKDNLLFASEQSLSYLDGSLPADYGFDPLGLSDPDGAGGFITPEWLRYSEVIHCRFAMLGAAGILAPSVLSYAGWIPQTPEEVTWFKTGVIPPLGTYETGYWADPYTLFFLEIIAFQFAELRRWQDYRKPGSMGKQYFLGLESVLGGSGDPAYPGGQFFNLLGLGKNGDSMKELQTKEIKNGRLAMLAVFGFGAQAVLTNTDPVKNLLDHLNNPIGSNLVTNLSLALGSS